LIQIGRQYNNGAINRASHDRFHYAADAPHAQRRINIAYQMMGMARSTPSSFQGHHRGAKF
jgi:hypothetical protein